MKKALIISLALLAHLAVSSQTPQTLKLLAPQLDKGSSLMNALAERHSTRTFAAGILSLGDISNLLWAANGINRPKEMKHTAPTARNWQDIDVYVVMEKGAYLYNPHDSTLVGIAAGDFRSQAGTQDFVKNAPLNLIYVSDFDRMKQTDEQSKLTYSAADAAFAAQNVYLCCSAFGLGCVVRASVDKEAMAKTLKLTASQHIILGQTVGYLP